MKPEQDVADLCAALSGDARLRDRLVSVIWIGSRSRTQDVHFASDLDIQIVLDRPCLQATVALSEILPGHAGIDLSILYVKDVFAQDGTVDFQDGTKGPFFISVLAAGEVVFGSDFYAPLREDMALEQIRPSLRFTIREYLARLRVLATQGENAPYLFKKYVLKYLRDVLVYEGHLSICEMPQASNAVVLRRLDDTKRMDPALGALLVQLTDFSRPFYAIERAALLDTLESLYDSLSSLPANPA